MSVRADLELRLQGYPGLVRRPSRFGDAYSYFVGDREIAHFHGDGRMDIRLTHQRIREMKDEGILDQRVRTRGPSADWASLPLAEPRELSLALELIEEAIRANQ
jgi:luciferase-like monooxygenase